MRNNNLKRQIPGGITAQQKLIDVANKFGNKGLAQQQGSTIIKYDTLQFDGTTNFRFFEGSSQRNFPLSNTGSDGNKLGVGSSMIVQRAYLSIVQYDKVKNTITNVAPLEISGAIENTAAITGEFNFEIANSQVMKNIPIMSWLPEFNKNAENALSTSFEFDTLISIQPLLEFVATVRVPAYTVDENPQYLRLTIEGVGSIIAPKSTM